MHALVTGLGGDKSEEILEMCCGWHVLLFLPKAKITMFTVHLHATSGRATPSGGSVLCAASYMLSMQIAVCLQ